MRPRLVASEPASVRVDARFRRRQIAVTSDGSAAEYGIIVRVQFEENERSYGREQVQGHIRRT